ncbi:MAG: glutamate-ammonia-ligase adenylyltransferase [Deltaproteobacteria bacterium]|nr:glutamate-ammonia-ligase adenylyltransferase [Deltaproteobacteria bacterium]
MKPDSETFKNMCPEISGPFIEGHVFRLSERYFAVFSEKDICRHLRALSRLDSENPVEILLERRKDGSVDCTVLGFDYPSVFSIITGILAAMGFSIISGDIYTYSQAETRERRRIRGRKAQRRAMHRDPLRRRRIVDHFSGVISEGYPFREWIDEFRKRMTAAVSLLEKGDEESVGRAKQQVNEMVVRRLAQIQRDAPPVLYPIRIEVDNESDTLTRLKVVSEDTPAFLYSLSNALSLHRVSIEHMRIRTIRGRIEDELLLADHHGMKIQDENLLDRIRLSVLLTKQFTYFLGQAPDPYQALSRFEYLVDDIMKLPAQGKWLDLLADPQRLQGLAQLLGASDYLWEDFIRLQYESLLPMLKPHLDGMRVSKSAESLHERLDSALHGCESLEEKRRALNAFKDREIFLIDLDHILDPESGFMALSKRLTGLAETIVSTAVRLIYRDLTERFGRPKSVAGLEVKHAVLGLGKLGGAALGYASDIELLLVYSDNGKTDGEESIENAVFFDKLVREVLGFIEAKRDGIFRIDLRLRPYGNAGPLASSLENFCRYYGSEGSSHSYERLALVRMRTVGGDREFGARLERLRDEMVYAFQSLDLSELQELRKKQYQEKAAGGRLNAKFSPGALVDLEYGIQILQVKHGQNIPKLRTPLLHEALYALGDVGVLLPEEAVRLISDYHFLRKLINGMRMLRGSARDLFLPEPSSEEYRHLARRMGYRRGGALEPAEQLRIDFETHTASVRAFMERHFGRKALPGPGTGTMADVILSPGLSKEIRNGILSNAGFNDPERAYRNLAALADKGSRQETFARLAVLARDFLSRQPDPDMALNNWERFARVLPSPEFHFGLLLSQPMRLEILLGIFSGSQFLADTLVRNPEFFEWITIPEILHKTRRTEDIADELRKAGKTSGGHHEWLNKLRRLRRREILRIGTRDICLGVPTREVMGELSAVAEAVVQVAVEKIWEDLINRDKAGPGEELETRFCVLALGKLGGNELNYSSDIDLLGLCEYPDAASSGGSGKAFYKELFAQVMEKVLSDLSRHTEEGYAYRVDLRLRPFGRSGELVPPFSALENYYYYGASLWELQAALKMRPIAGNLQLGYRFLKKIEQVLKTPREISDIAATIERMREESIRSSARGLGSTINVKTGAGGLRDVEFLVQGLQLRHAHENHSLLQGNTLLALEALGEGGLLPMNTTEELKEDYLFLRKVEHYLQILEDRQIHTLPTDEKELDFLARRISGVDRDRSQFLEELNQRNKRIRNAYETYLVRAKE